MTSNYVLKNDVGHFYAVFLTMDAWVLKIENATKLPFPMSRTIVDKFTRQGVRIQQTEVK